MKRITNIILTIAAVICLAASCQKEEVTSKLDSALVGEWHLASTYVDGEELKGAVDVYLVLVSDGTFALYQRTGSQEDRYDLYTGTCTSEDGILTGTYASGTPWGSSYKYKVTGSSLTLTSSDLLEEQVYDKESLPSDIKVNTDTRSVELQTPIL
jgi:hypothetical protein